jgi:hypothetical protein
VHDAPTVLRPSGITFAQRSRRSVCCQLVADYAYERGSLVTTARRVGVSFAATLTTTIGRAMLKSSSPTTGYDGLFLLDFTCAIVAGCSNWASRWPCGRSLIAHAPRARWGLIALEAVALLGIYLLNTALTAIVTYSGACWAQH